MRVRLFGLVSVIVVLAMLLAACAAAVPAAAPAEPAAGGEASWWKTAAEAAGCVGVTINGVTESTPPANFAKEVLAPAFEKETGIKVELETTSWDRDVQQGHQRHAGQHRHL